MDLQSNSLNSRADLSQFLEKFKEPAFASAEYAETARPAVPPAASSKSNQHEKTFEKLEQKIEELEARFDAAAGQNQLILAELTRQREIISNQQDRDAFVEHLSHTIANLKASVENLARVQTSSVSFPTGSVQRSFDTEPRRFATPADMYQYEPETYSAFREQRRRAAQEERERIIASLHQKASQLKAVNSALDREIKKVQQEKMAALKKSAEQAKEILSLREQLTATEEKFKSFDFEGRIISIRQEYEQKVSSLETQLQEISATCMKQVEEIESLRTQNLKLQRVAEEKEQVQARLKQKEEEVEALKAQIAKLEQDHNEVSKQQLDVFAQRLRTLESQRDELNAQLQAAQEALENVRGEKKVLEKNFKELLEKINQNDSIIAQLKQKIEVLGKQNQTLSEQNTQLAEEKSRWEGEKVSYEMRARSAEQDREVLITRTEALAHAKHTVEAQVEELTQAKHTVEAQVEELTQAKKTVEAQVSELTQANAALAQEKNAAQAQVKQLTGEKESLAKKAKDFQQKTDFLLEEKAALHKENQQLRNQSAALLAARLVQEKNNMPKEETVPLVSAPANPTAKQAAPAVKQAAPAVKQPVAKQEPAAKKEPAVKQEPLQAAPAKKEEASFDGPVTITERAKASVTTSADLPEIKVAEPVEQPQSTFDGEDFLEKTDSFLGRMKWSLFREDK